MWGVCSNGTEAVGCGRSETFRNCADVSVVTSTGGVPPAFAGDLRRDYPFLLYYRDLNMPRNVYPLVVRFDNSIYNLVHLTVSFVYIVCIFCHITIIFYVITLYFVCILLFMYMYFVASLFQKKTEGYPKGIIHH